MTNIDSSVTQLISKWSSLSEAEKELLICQLYPNLKRIASIQLNKHPREITQCTTEIVNEAYIKLTNLSSIGTNKDHFLAISATVMRRLIVDLTRNKLSKKRGSGVNFENIEDVEIAVPFNFSNWIDLNNTIEELHSINPIYSKIIELKLIMGYKLDEISRILEISIPTISRNWKFCKVWLRDAKNN